MPFFEAGAFWAGHTEPEWNPGQRCVMLGTNQYNVLGEAEIIRKIGDNLYLAEYNGVRCTAIFNPFVSRYFVDDLYGIAAAEKYAG